MSDSEKISDEERAELMLRWERLKDEIATRGESAAARVQLANVHLRLGERLEAMMSLQIALRLRPEESSILSKLKEICTEEEFAHLELPREIRRSRNRPKNPFKRVRREDYQFSKDATGFLRMGVVIIAAIYFFWCLGAGNWHFLDNLDLVIHEIGHPLFSAFGEFIGMAGGTIIQITVPLAFILYFAFTRRLFSAAIVMFWLGQSFLNVSVYAADAIEMKLPLVGGNIHDWNYLLSHLNVLSKTNLIAGIIRNTGIIIMAAATVIGLITSFYQKSDLSYLQE